jgi:ABC-2 type transport system permease protein
MKLWIALRKEMLEQWRTYRLLVVAVVLLAFGFSSPLLAKFTPQLVGMVPGGELFIKLIPPPTILDAVAQYIKNANQFAVLLAVLLGMGAIAQEKDKGTAALMLVKPLPRSAFLLAKFGALGLTFTLSTALAGLACYYYTYVLFDALPVVPWLALNGLMLLTTLLYLALTLLCSALTRSQAVAGGMSFGLLIILSVVGSLPRLGEYMPGQLLNWGAALMAGPAKPAWGALAVTVGLIVAAVTAACLAFQGQEL